MSPAELCENALAEPGEAPRLSREATGARAAPVRIVHMGLGAFHRAHQAWYTAACRDADDWGIAAFTGRSPTAAEALSAQGGVYSMIVRGHAEDRATVVESVSAAFDGADMAAFRSYLSAPSTALVTLTVTEPGYCLRPNGELDIDGPAIAADLPVVAQWLTAATDGPAGGGSESVTSPSTALGRLLVGLDARRHRDGGPIAVVPCDNIPANGTVVQRALSRLAQELNPDLAHWMALNVSFVSTSVDRITPRTTEADRGTALALTGYVDACPVVTEPFTDWILSGEFPAGRPEWDSVGARIVDDIEPYEQRKLRLLNGAHSLIAYLGMVRGHSTVCEAISDPTCRAAVEQYWAEARDGMPELLHVDDYCTALIERFSNPRMAHHLDQIGLEGVNKLAVRIVPVALRERAVGRTAAGCVTPLAAWVALATRDKLPADVHSDAIAAAAASADPTPALIGLLDAGLATDTTFTARIRRCAKELGRTPGLGASPRVHRSPAGQQSGPTQSAHL